MTARRGPARRKASEAEAWRSLAEWFATDPSHDVVRWATLAVPGAFVRLAGHFEAAHRPVFVDRRMRPETAQTARVIFCLLMALECEDESRSLPARSRK